MTEHTANEIVDSRSRMLAPLAIFFAACFLFAGAVKFHVMGGDLWIARPMGAPVTCLFLAFVGFAAARWFFGTKPATPWSQLLAALVIILPLMGFLGVVQNAMQDPAGPEDATPLGGALGAMLAGPRAFGSLGQTIAGILFATLTIFGAYLAKRIVSPAEPPASREDPYALIKMMNARRADKAATETEEGGVVVIDDGSPDDEEPVAEAAFAARPRGELFPHDAELEPHPSEAGPSEEETVRVFRVAQSMAEPEEPVRMPILAGLVETVPEESEQVMVSDAAHLFVPSMETAAEEAPGLSLDADEAPVAVGTMEEVADEITGETDDEEAVDEDDDTAPPPFAVRPPALEPPEEDVADEPGEEPEDEEVEAAFTWTPALELDETGPAPEAAAGHEAPELRPEWLAAPAAFHMPRAIQGEIEADEPFGEILDVGRMAAEEEEGPALERPRFRVKADYVRHDEPAPAAETPAEARVADVEEEQPAVEPEPVLESQAPVRGFEPAAAVEEGEDGHGDETPAVESQLEFPAASFAPAGAEEEPADAKPERADEEPAEDEAPRPRRRMRSAAKDWASWEDAPKDRPRLRLVKEDEEGGAEAAKSGSDDAYDRAVKLVVGEDRCSVSLLQRNLGVTFGEATALIDRMFQNGVVGPYQPTGRRDVLAGKKGAAAAGES